MPGMSHTPSGQNVATTSSVRPSSSAWVYAAMLARTPSATSAKVVLIRYSSYSNVDDWHFERVHVDRLQGREQLLVREAGEKAVDRSFEVRDVSLGPLGEAHVLETLVVQAPLLT